MDYKLKFRDFDEASDYGTQFKFPDVSSKTNQNESFNPNTVSLLNENDFYKRTINADLVLINGIETKNFQIKCKFIEIVSEAFKICTESLEKIILNIPDSYRCEVLNVVGNKVLFQVNIGNLNFTIFEEDSGVNSDIKVVIRNPDNYFSCNNNRHLMEIIYGVFLDLIFYCIGTADDGSPSQYIIDKRNNHRERLQTFSSNNNSLFSTNYGRTLKRNNSIQTTTSSIDISISSLDNGSLNVNSPNLDFSDDKSDMFIGYQSDITDEYYDPLEVFDDIVLKINSMRPLIKNTNRKYLEITKLKIEICDLKNRLKKSQNEAEYYKNKLKENNLWK
uniref:Uncharacterized protein n=1 Tax=viral metagenome TaxID=1070528 RepID=A0A6C0BCU0_9ZZZZ